MNSLMGRTRLTRLASLMSMAALLVLIPGSESEPVPRPPHPLGLSQFALANHACALIPYSPVPDYSVGPAPPSSLVPNPSFDKLDHGHHHGHGHRHRQHHHESEAEEECCRR